MIDPQKNSDFEKSVDLKKEISYYLYYWPWFLISIIITISGAFLYLRYSTNIYQTTAQIQIKNDSDASAFLTSGVNDLFNVGQDNIQNEVAVIKSNHILEKVISKTDLRTKIFKIGKFKNTLQYNNELPFIIKYKDSKSSDVWTAERINNEIILSNSKDVSYKIKRNEKVDNEQIFFEPKEYFFNSQSVYEIYNYSQNNTLAILRNELKVEPFTVQSEIVNFTYNGQNVKLNEAILNTLIDVVSEDQVRDKRKISEVSKVFIDERLKVLSKDIDTISKSTILFQTQNEVYDSKKQTESALENILFAQKEVLNIKIQLEIVNSLLEKLESTDSFSILPANVGVANNGLNVLIEKYNSVVTQRDNLLLSSTEKSPLVSQLSIQLVNLKNALIEGITSHISSLNVSLKSYQKSEDRTLNMVSELPTKENKLRSYSRNFQIAEQLYIFLLERKEEAAITYISALPSLKVLSYGVTILRPISPKPNVTYLASLIIGSLIPFLILFLIKTLNTRINNREDIAKILPNVSILGEVPHDESINNKNLEEDHERGVTVESSRVLRSNLSFLVDQKKSDNVLLVTSTIKGEGKSFVSYNIAKSYADLGKKVILIGADLRNPQLHNRLKIKRSPIGLSTFLSDNEFSDVDSLITKIDTGNLDFLLSGATPPNPAELLMRPRMKEIIEIMKEKYDYVILDTAPMLLVSDTAPMLRLSDLVVYVCRSQYTEKSLLTYIDNFQGKPDVPPFAIVINGIKSGPSNGYNYKYSYNYGYGYGYGNEKK